MVLITLLSEWGDRGMNPWAYAKPSLTGDWQGETLAGNTRLRLVFSLSRVRGKFDWLGDDDSAFNNDRELSGRVMLCDSTGRVQSYPVHGSVDDRHARRSVLSVSPPPDEIPGLRPARIVLSWDGGTALHLQTELVHARVGSVWSSSSEPETGRPISFLLHPSAGQSCVVP